MERLGLKDDIIKAIKDDALLFGKVADILSVSPFTLPRLLKINDKKLTQADVLKGLRDHLGDMQDNELLELIPDEQETAAA